MRPPNFVAPKRVSTPKEDKFDPKFVFPIFQMEISWNHMYSPNLIRNGWKLLHLGLTALSGTQICRSPICGKKLEICPLPHFMQQKPAKFQVHCSEGSIVMRPPNFGAPKRITPKGSQIGPKWSFLFSRWRYMRSDLQHYHLLLSNVMTSDFQICSLY